MIESTPQKSKAKLYQKPNKSQFQRSVGCENFCRSHDICLTFPIWYLDCFQVFWAYCACKWYLFTIIIKGTQYAVYQYRFSLWADSDTTNVNWERSWVAYINRRRQIFSTNKLWKNHVKYIAVIFCP